MATSHTSQSDTTESTTASDAEPAVVLVPVTISNSSSPHSPRTLTLGAFGEMVEKTMRLRAYGLNFFQDLVPGETPLSKDGIWLHGLECWMYSSHGMHLATSSACWALTQSPEGVVCGVTVESVGRVPLWFRVSSNRYVLWKDRMTSLISALSVHLASHHHRHSSSSEASTS